jgi:hypothetical protein
MSSKADNIFWKMIDEQKKGVQHKLEPQEFKDKATFSKPIKNRAIQDKIDKFSYNPLSQSINKKQKKNKDIQEDKISKLSTFNKIIILQNLCKELISSKERFSKNKTQIINKINNNSYDYFKNKIIMKEIYDFCQSKKYDEHIDYVLIEQPEKYFDDKYEIIYNFFFLLRNNNKLMLKLINNCKEENYEQISDFIVNFFYEDTINSSFIQEELMLVIYLIFEKHFYEKLPDVIKDDENMISYDIIRDEKNILYHIIKSLTRKADIRNFLCCILVNDILKLEGYRKYLSPDIFSKKNFEEDDNDLKENNHENREKKHVKRHSLIEELEDNFKLKLNSRELNSLKRSITKKKFS